MCGRGRGPSRVQGSATSASLAGSQGSFSPSVLAGELDPTGKAEKPLW